MTTAAKNNWLDGHKIFQSLVSGVALYLLINIFNYQKKTYDWQIMITNRMEAVEKRQDSHADLIFKGQGRADDQANKMNAIDNKIVFLFAHFGIIYTP